MPNNFFEDYLNQTDPNRPEPNPLDTYDSTRNNVTEAIKSGGMNPINVATNAMGVVATEGFKRMWAVGNGVLGFWKGVADAFENDPNHLPDLSTVASEAVYAGAAQYQRMVRSNNFTELMENAYTGEALLKSLPGAIGESFKRADPVDVGILGFALETVLDPLSKISNVSKNVGKAAGLAGLALDAARKSGRAVSDVARLDGAVNTRVADRVGDFASHIATGNIAGMAVFSTRETANAIVAGARNIARDPSRGSLATNTAKALEWLVGPLATTHKPDQRTFMKYMAAKEETPREMLAVAKRTQAATAFLSARVDPETGVAPRAEAKALFSKIKESTITEPDAVGPAYDRLLELGVERKVVDSILGSYYKASVRTLDLLTEAGVDLNLRQDYLYNAYKLHSPSPRVRTSLFDQLLASKLPAKVAFRYGELGDNLRAAFGVTDEVVRDDALAPYQRPPITVRESGVYADVPTREVPTGLSTIPAYDARPAPVEGVFTRTEAGPAIPGRTGDGPTSPVGGPGSRYAPIPVAPNTLVGPIGGGPTPLDAPIPPAPRVTSSIADDTIEAEFTSTPIPRGPTIAGELPAPNDVTVGFDPTAPRGPFVGGGYGAIPELPHRTAFRQAVTPVRMTKAITNKFVADLMDFMEGTYKMGEEGRGIIGEPMDNTGKTAADWEARRLATQKTTMADVHDFVRDFAEREGLSDDVRKKLLSNAHDSLAYVPSDREFVYRMRELNDKDWLNTVVGQNGMRPLGINSAAVEDRSLESIYFRLYGKIDDFAVRVAEQATAQGELVARAQLFKNMRENGMVSERQFPGYVPLPEGIKGFESDTPLYIAQGELQSLRNVDRKFEMGKGERALASMSNLFRRSQLLNSPAAVATQILGNWSMLAMQGYPMFSTRELGRMRHTFRHLVNFDEVHNEAVAAGVQIQMNLLNEGTVTKMADELLLRDATLGNPRRTWYDPRSAVEQISSIWMDTVGRHANRENAIAAQVQNIADRGGDVAGAMNNPRIAGQTDAGSIFSLPDQITRMQAYTYDTNIALQKLLKANPELRAFVRTIGDKGGTQRIDFDAIETYNARTKIPGSQIEVEPLREAWKQATEDAAERANDVALNYFDVPRAIEALSRTGLVPFIKYPYKATGRIMEWMDEKPAVFLPFLRASSNSFSAFTEERTETWASHTATMPEYVRSGLTLRSGVDNGQGKPEVLNLTNWIPFGGHLGASGNIGSETPGYAPNSLISLPIAETVFRIASRRDINGRPVQPDGQSWTAFAATELARLLAPNSIGPGGRRVAALAEAIEAEQELGMEPSVPPGVGEAISTYARLPAMAGQALETLATGGNPSGGTEGFRTQPSPNLTPQVTPRQAILRFGVPGAGVTADYNRQYETVGKVFDKQIQDRTAELNDRIRQIQSVPGRSLPELNQQIESLQRTIRTLEDNKMRALERFFVGR